jgi:hypothetical protein
LVIGKSPERPSGLSSISISRTEKGSAGILHRGPEVFLALSLKSFLRLLESRYPRGNLVAFRR